MKKHINIVLEEELFDYIEYFRKSQDISRSKAIGLLIDALKSNLSDEMVEQHIQATEFVDRRQKKFREE